MVHHTQHYASNASRVSSAPGADITFTATTAAGGDLLVGSSREFGGVDATMPDSAAVVGQVLERAAVFLPDLAGIRADAATVRIGARPWSKVGSLGSMWHALGDMR